MIYHTIVLGNYCKYMKGKLWWQVLYSHGENTFIKKMTRLISIVSKPIKVVVVFVIIVVVVFAKKN